MSRRRPGLGSITMASTPRIPPGVGIYTVTDAAQLLGIHTDRVRRWVKGYRYYPHGVAASEGRDRPPVVEMDVPAIGGTAAISFLELMELRIIRDLLQYPGISLQKIRKAGHLAGQALGTSRPWAIRRIFTDGSGIFVALHRGDEISPDVMGLTRSRALQVDAGELVQPFLDEIEFDEQTGLSRQWWPLGKSFPVVLDPKVSFGAPTIKGSRIRTNVITGFARSESSASLAAAYAIPAGHVEAAIHFEGLLAAA